MRTLTVNGIEFTVEVRGEYMQWIGEGNRAYSPSFREPELRAWLAAYQRGEVEVNQK